MPKKPAAKPRKRPAKAAKPRRRAAAPPKPARARKAPQRAARAPKVPARFRALGGVDPRTLPPGTPYPCTDGYVGAVVRGDKLAGRIVACATPPVGSRGQHYVLGKVASGRAISAEFRKGYKVAEKVAAVQRERARRDSIRTPEAAGPSFAPRVKQASVERRSQRVEVAAQPVPARIFRMELLGDAAEALYYTRPFLVLADGTRFAIDFYHHRDGHGEPLLACGPGLISEKAYDTVKVMPLLGEDVARELAAALAGIGVSVRLVDVTGDYAVFATTAPDAYDGMGTVAIKHGFTPADIDDWSRQRYQWRAILVPRRSVEWQTMRNSSGNHPSWPSSLGEVSGLVPVAPKVTAPTAEPQEPYVVTYGTPPDQPVATITQHWWPSADGLLALTIRVEAWHYRPDPGVGSGWTFVVAKNGHDQGESSSISFLRDIIGDTERWREATAGVLMAIEARYPGAAEAILEAQLTQQMPHLLPDGAYVQAPKSRGRPEDIMLVLGEWMYARSSRDYRWPSGRMGTSTVIPRPIDINSYSSQELKLEWLWERIATVVFRDVLLAHNRVAEHPSDRSHAQPATFSMPSRKSGDRRPVVTVGTTFATNDAPYGINPDDFDKLAKDFAKRLGLKVKAR